MPIPDNIARLNANGSLDTTFTPAAGLDGPGLCVCVMQDGVIAVGGAFLEAGAVNRNRLAFFNPNGSVRAENIVVNWDVKTMVRQADGSVIVAGRFTTAGGVSRGRILRLTPSRALDAAFDPRANGTVNALALAEDGKVYAGGVFSMVGGHARAHLVRLHNVAAPQSLTAVDASTVRWLRGGGMPETARVVFEIDTGSGFGALAGTVSRISGGWEVTGLSLSGSGTLRARALPSDSHSGSAIEETATFNIAPEITVLADGTARNTGDTLAYADTQTGTTRDVIVTIRNTGLANLALTGGAPVTKTGTNADQWTIVSQPSSPIAPGAAASFTLRFGPTSTGAKVAALAIASDDADENPFTLNLTATAVPGPGSVDTSWQPVVNGSVSELAMRGSNIVIGGAFTTVNSILRGRFAELTAAGTLRDYTGAGANNTVTALCVMPDLSLLLAGAFTTVNGASRKVARILPNNTLDSLNAAYTGGDVLELLPGLDGSVFVIGLFTTWRGAARRACVKLLPDGSTDASWTGLNEASAFCGAVLADGTLFLGTSHRGVVKILPNGTVDSAFNSAAAIPAGTVQRICLQPDGSMIVAGFDGSYTRYVKRITSTGVLDGTFTAAGSVAGMNDILLQTDGKLIVSSTDSATHRRLTATGTADTSITLAAETAGLNNLMCLDESGRLHFGGSQVRRLVGGSCTSALTVISPTLVQWERGGMTPEAQWVRFDLSEDGTTWTVLGAGSRVAGGWQRAVNLPRSGQIRARALTGTGIVEQVTVFAGLAVPDIAVSLAGTAILDNGTVHFPGRIPGQSVELAFTIENTGLAPLTISASTGGEFSVSSLDATTIAPGSTATLKVLCAPTLVGMRTAILQIATNVPGSKSVFSIVCYAYGITNPAAITDAATNRTSTAARLPIRVTANADTGEAWVRYRRAGTADAWTVAPVPAWGIAGYTAVSLMRDIAGLIPNTTYEFQAVARNALSTKEGTLRTFATLAP